MNTLCLYHKNCVDGFGAAWALREAFWRTDSPVEFVAAAYGDVPPDVTDRDVYIVDFSYKRDVLLEMAKVAKKIVILDHHKSAAEDLKDLPENVYAIFDMNRSGARMTWDYFFPEQDPPLLLSHIEDRDLWRFTLDDTKAVIAALFSHPYDFDVWDRLMWQHIEVLRSEGQGIQRKHLKDIRELLSTGVRLMIIGGFYVPVANLPYIFSSEAGNLLASGEYTGGAPSAFGACYWDDKTHRIFSLRSTDAGEDVSKIAKRYGGGGHRNAAGFKILLPRLQEHGLL